MPATITLADRVQALRDRHEATFERSVNEDGSVKVVLHLAAGDSFSGVGPTTEDAVKALETKMEKLADVL